MKLPEKYLADALSIEEYHAGVGVSSTTLRKYASLPPAYAKRELEARTVTGAMVVGDMLHAATFEPERLERMYCSEPEVCADDGEPINRRKPSHRAYLTRWRADREADGYRFVKADDLADMVDLARLLWQSKTFSSLCRGGEFESSLYWMDDTAGGMILKSRPDCIHNGIIVELKKAVDTTARGFRRDAFRLGYPIQAAMSWDGYTAVNGEEPKAFVWVAINEIERTPEFYMADDGVIRFGRMEYKRALKIFSECADTSVWPSATAGKIENLGLPSWAANLMEENDV